MAATGRTEVERHAEACDDARRGDHKGVQAVAVRECWHLHERATQNKELSISVRSKLHLLPRVMRTSRQEPHPRSSTQLAGFSPASRRVRFTGWFSRMRVMQCDSSFTSCKPTTVARYHVLSTASRRAGPGNVANAYLACERRLGRVVRGPAKDQRPPRRAHPIQCTCLGAVSAGQRSSAGRCPSSVPVLERVRAGDGVREPGPADANAAPAEERGASGTTVCKSPSCRPRPACAG